MYFDRNDTEVKEGDVINLHQTVNGNSSFVVKRLNPIEIVYLYDLSRRYEYSEIDLLKPSFLIGETEFEIEYNIKRYLIYQKNKNGELFLLHRNFYKESKCVYITAPVEFSSVESLVCFNTEKSAKEFVESTPSVEQQVIAALISGCKISIYE